MKRAVASLLAWAIAASPWAQYSAYAGPQTSIDVAPASGVSIRVVPRGISFRAQSISTLLNWNPLAGQLLTGFQPRNPSVTLEPNSASQVFQIAATRQVALSAQAFLLSGGAIKTALNSHAVAVVEKPIFLPINPALRASAILKPAIPAAKAFVENTSPFAKPLQRTLSAVRRLGTLEASAPETFDGASDDNLQADPIPAASAPAPKRGMLKHLAGATLGRLIPNLAARWGWRDPPPPKNFGLDSYGGPQPEYLPLKGRILAGLKVGFNLLGIGAFIKLVIAPLLALAPWPLWVPESWLGPTGRMEFLTRIGPEGIAQAMGTNPLLFMLWDLPRMALQEEIIFRLLTFGLLFIAITAIKPVTAGLSKAIGHLPDLFGARNAAQRVLGWVGKLSSKAFWIAASLSALSFTVAHFALWGINPYLLLLHFISALVLVYAAYKTQSLLVPFIAHYFYNLANVLLDPGASQFSAVAATTSMGYLFNIGALVVLWYNWRSYRQSRAAAWEQAREEQAIDPQPTPATSSWNIKWAGRALLELGVLLAPLAAYAFIYSKFFATALASNQFFFVIAAGSGTMLGMLALAALGTFLQHRIRAWLRNRAARVAGRSIPAPKKSGARALVAMGLLLALINAVPLIPWAFKSAEIQMLDQAALIAPGAAPIAPSAAPRPIPKIVAEVSPSVVMVIVQEGGHTGLGTGFIVNKNGRVATNAHVVSMAKEGDEVLVRLRDPAHGDRLFFAKAKILSVNMHDDLALLQLPPALPAGWPAVRLGDSTKVNIGDTVLALGHPFGLEATATQGILSGRGNRSGVNPHELIGFLQIDAPINPGNSGGPLVNLQGEVIGINTLKRGEGAEGIGFAREGEYLKSRLAQYDMIGNIHSGWAGALINLKSTEKPPMLRVEYVRPGSPAERAGLKSGDAILGVNNAGLPINLKRAGPELWRRIAHLPPGHPVTLTIQRNYQRMQLAITLEDETNRPDPLIERWLNAIPSFSWDEMFKFNIPAPQPGGH